MKDLSSMPSVIFFDIDGTLVTEDECAIVPDSAQKAIVETRKRGNLTFINTGRTAFNISSRIRNLGFDGYISGCGTYIEYGGKVIFENRLDPKLCREIARLMRECHVTPVYEDREGYFFDGRLPMNDVLRNFLDVFVDPDIDISRRVDDDDFVFDKFVVWLDDNSDEEKFRSVAGEYFEIIDRGGRFFENVPLGFSKASGIKIILDKLGIPIANAYAIGDSMNDLSMLQVVPNSIAMGGAVQIYPYVSYITTPIMEDGIANALKHFNLI